MTRKIDRGKKETAAKALVLLKDLLEAAQALPDEDTDLGPVEFEKRWETYHAVCSRARRFLAKGGGK